MDCLIPETLYLQGNGVFSCHDDAGVGISLGQLSDTFSLRAMLEEAYDHMRHQLAAGRAPWPGVCERCGFFRPTEPYRARPVHRITTFQVETTLRCTLVCGGCTRLEEIRTRPGPASLTLDRFERLLTTAAAEGIEIEWIEYCGHGEPLAHRDFHRFAGAARRILPDTRQRLITNANYDYDAVMRGQHVDEIVVSCDGASSATYPIYRQHGDFDRVQGFIAAAMRATPRPRVVWKYILFDFNDSDAELQHAQALAMAHGVDTLLFVVTHSDRRSQRYTARNLDEVLRLIPFATVNTTPVLETACDARSARAELRRAAFARVLGTTVAAVARRVPGPIPAPAGLYVDETRVIASGAIHVRGWAHDGREPFRRLTLTWNGREVGTALLGLPRPDVGRVFPRLRSDRVGFAAVCEVPDIEAAAFELAVRATPAGARRHHTFTVRVTQDRRPIRASCS
jgi:hypothetical protein